MRAQTPQIPFRRLAIVNRAEPAVRVINAARELNEEGCAELRMIALHTEAERRARFVREADEAHQVRGYLDHGELEAALRATHADAAWVGWGFVAEDPAFAELCERLGMVFIGPSAEAMRRLGDKIGAKELAERAGIPLVPWSGGPVETIDEARAQARALGYPLAIKARAGGGGRGIRKVDSDDQLTGAWEQARREAEQFFGDPAVFMEQLLVGARHVEVQILADHYGTVWPVGVRDCSIQRRNQKIIEESSSTALSPEQEEELRAAAVQLATEAGYRGAGTIELLYQPQARQFSFLECNTRLQVEHPVTEATTGLDLVKLQLRVAAGGRLEGRPPPSCGHAIEARLNAEDPERDFAPAPGAVELLELPSGPGIRVDAGVGQGDVIPPDFDSMIAKVVAWGRDRVEARARLRRALAQTTVVIRNGTTNKAFLLGVLGRDEMASGELDVEWLERAAVEQPAQGAQVALLAAAVGAYDGELALDRAGFYASAARGRPQARREVGHAVELRHRGHAYHCHVARLDPWGRYRIDVDGQLLDVELERLRPLECRLSWAGRTFAIVSRRHGADHLIEVDGVPHRVSLEEGGVVRAPGPGLVVAVRVGPGEEVESGATLAVLESMKMETAIPAPYAGRVSELLVQGNVQVDAGAPLCRLEPAGHDGGVTSAEGPRLQFRDSTCATGRTTAASALGDLRRLSMGFDFDEEKGVALSADYERLAAAASVEDTQLLEAELDLLRTFADLCQLTRSRSLESEEGKATRIAREHFLTYLRSLDPDREGLPEEFREHLGRALAHYGVTGFERTPELEDALYRIHQAHDRVSAQLPAIRTVLSHLHVDADATPDALREQLRETLDRIMVAAQLRYPAVGQLARSVRYRYFDWPLIAGRRERVHDAMRVHLEHLAVDPEAGDAPERMAALLDCPEPLVGILAEPRGGRDPLPEVLTRRYYKVCEIGDVRSWMQDGRELVTGRCAGEGGPVQVVAAIGVAHDPGGALRAAGSLAQGVSGTAVADVYLRAPAPAGDLEATAAELQVALQAADLPDPVERVTLARVHGQRGAAGAEAGAELFTFRRSPDGPFEEDRILRGLHPMVAQRLQLWRLSNFEIDRLPAPEDVHVFHCVAHENLEDERLIALAEVRDLTAVRDGSGRIAELPELERVLGTCLDGLRQQISGASNAESPGWNRVLLFVQPPLEARLEELAPMYTALAPMIEGLGLEEVAIQGRLAPWAGGDDRDRVLRLITRPGHQLTVRLDEPPTRPLQPLDAYTHKVQRARRRGLVPPYEIVPLLTREHQATAGGPPAGTFTEYDLDEEGCLAPVARARGENTAGVVVGVIQTPTTEYPEGMTRVALFSDPTRSLGALAEPECRRVIEALRLASELGVPVEWFTHSSGAKISMDSGTENMDWVARVLRSLVQFTQAGGEVNVVVVGVNVGAQPYWNAEATMLMHTRGILIMTQHSAMVLTGKQALDYSGGVSAEDNLGIGGFDRIMGPNGEAQYWAADITGACELLLAYYERTYVAPGERFPRRAGTGDDPERDVCEATHHGPGTDFARIGDVFSEDTNPGRKRPFDIRSLLVATIDADRPPLERWANMRAGTAVVLDAHLGGHPVCMLGVESRPLPRYGHVPADGPEQWSAGTLFPWSSRKVARAINAASGKRPVVVLANLSGFDGSPESMRDLQLEYGAEIGRAVVNFRGPIVFCVVSRYHGGAFVVFSQALNDELRVLAVEGSHASVIGGGPAAGVVFGGEVDRRTREDPRVAEVADRLGQADESQRACVQSELDDATAAVRAEHLGQLATEFDRIHSIERARQVGSVHEVVSASRLRPALIDAVCQGIDRASRAAGCKPDAEVKGHPDN